MELKRKWKEMRTEGVNPFNHIIEIEWMVQGQRMPQVTEKIHYQLP